MIFVGIIIVIIAVYLLIKQYESRAVLFCAGLLMAILAGNPMAALDAFSERMTNAGMITAICSVMGFAMVMKITKCDQHLVNFIVGGLSKFTAILIPGATIATFLINIALTSAAGVSAAVGAIFIPILMASGVAPATAAAAVLAGTFGSMLSPGLHHTAMIAEMAGVGVMDVLAVKAVPDVIAVIIAAISLFIVAKILKEDKGYVLDEGNVKLEEKKEIEKPNLLFALVPIIPIIILVLGSTVVPAIKMGVPHAMLIGTIIATVITRTNIQDISKAFFSGMANAYGSIMGLIIAAAVFVAGMNSIGIVDAFINLLINSESVVKLAATFGPFILAVVSGSGEAATLAFNEAVTPQAQMLGLEIINMGSVAALAGALGRSMSPIAGATLICASIANVNPMELAKRNAPGMILAAVVAMFILL